MSERAPSQQPTPTEIEELRRELTETQRTIHTQARTIERLMDVLHNSQLPSAQDSATIETMDASPIDSGGKKKRRRGVPLESTGPIAKVALAMDVSVAEIARRLDENYQSVRTWDARNRVPDDVKRRLVDLLAAHKKAAKQTR